MREAKYKVGDRVRRVSSPIRYQGMPVGAEDTVTAVGDSGKSLALKVFGPGHSTVHFEFVARDLDHLQPGDILVDDEGDDREVYAVAGKLAAVSDGFNDGEYDFSWIHVGKLKSRDYSLKNQPAEVTELSVADIEARLELPSGSLRVKKD